MSKIIAALLYTFVTIFNALQSNSSLIENRALQAEGPKYVSKEELQYVVSLGVFRDENYVHICLAVMITGLNGITAGKCGHYEYYAERAGSIKSEKNLSEKKRTKLHVNTKRPMHFHPDTFYTVIRFIDFNEYLFDESREQNYLEHPNIGVFVLKKKVQHTRPVLNIGMSTIKKLPKFTSFTLIGMNTIDKRPLGEKMLMKKTIMKIDSYSHGDITSPLKYSQIWFLSDWHTFYECLTQEDLGAPVYFGDQYVGILVDNDWHATVAIDADLEDHINRIIASTWLPRIDKHETKGSAKAPTRNNTASRKSI